jgi:hypothetical protein
VFVAGHLDTPLPAEVTFVDTLAYLITGSGTYAPTPTYSSTALTCANTYCHGAWQMTKLGSLYPYIFTDSIMTGNTANHPLWTGGTSEASCGSCHGMPPTGHLFFSLSSCTNCHGSVVNGSGQIINQSLHINGKANVYGGERPY